MPNTGLRCTTLGFSGEYSNEQKQSPGLMPVSCCKHFDWRSRQKQTHI